MNLFVRVDLKENKSFLCEWPLSLAEIGLYLYFSSAEKIDFLFTRKLNKKFLWRVYLPDEFVGDNFLESFCPMA